jgi:hypothetical protein
VTLTSRSSAPDNGRIEEHFVTAEVRDAWRRIGREAADPSVAIHSGEIENRLLNLAEERVALMDETGLDVSGPVADYTCAP